jgi:hypothetical protein
MNASNEDTRPRPTSRAARLLKKPATLVALGVVVAAGVGIGVASTASGSGSHASTPTTQTTTTTIEAAPVLSPIQTVFDQPHFTTTYTEPAQAGPGATYTWSVSIPNDPGCAYGFTPGTPQPNQATWNHTDLADGGPCSHSGQDFGPSGHHGTITVVVTTTHWHCTATYDGTASGTGPAPAACTPANG